MVDGIRIIAGEGRGRYIKTFKNDLSVRPLLARIKKSLFDILSARIPGVKFLDLYAGTGAVGIEALSRGASRVVFVDGDRKCVDLIGQNLKDLGWSDRALIEQCDITRGLSWLKDKFDIVYLGPPYKDMERTPLALTGTTLQRVLEAGLVAENGLIISQKHIKEPVAEIPGIEAFRVEKYGDTVLTFYRKKKE